MSTGVVMQLDPADRLERLFAAEAYERPLLAQLSSLLTPGDAVIDGGAHVGYVGLHAAKFVGPQGMVAFVEADPRNAIRLRRNIALSELESAVFEAVLDEPGRGDIPFTRVLEPGETGWGSALVDPRPQDDQIIVPTITLDEIAEGLDPRPLRLIKLDLQGNEAAALRGAGEILAKRRPFIVCETVDVYWGPRQTDTVGAVLAILEEAGYRGRPLGRRVLRGSERDMLFSPV